MTISTILQALANYGFPIVMSLILFWYISKASEAHTDEVKRINDAHKAEISQLTRAVENNTIIQERTSEAIRILLDHFIEGGKKE